MTDQTPTYAMSEKMIAVAKTCSMNAQRYFALLLNLDPDVLQTPEQLDQFCRFVLALSPRQLEGARDEVNETLGSEEEAAEEA
mgnify:CR=1 FL=1